MRNMQKVLAVICVCALLLSCVAGCAPKNADTDPSATVGQTDPVLRDDPVEETRPQGSENQEGGNSLQEQGKPGEDTKNETEDDAGDTVVSATDPAKEEEPDTTEPVKEPEAEDEPAEEPKATTPAQEPEATDPAEEPEATIPAQEPEATTPAQELEATTPEKEEANNGVMVQVSADVNAKDDVLSEGVTLAGDSIFANVPQGVVLNENTSQLTLTVTAKEKSDSGVTLSDGQSMLPLDVHIEGVSANNTAPITVSLGTILPKGLNIGNYSLYHVENGASNRMNAVSTLDELRAHNDFVYDPATGGVTVSMASFSEVVVVSESAKWTGSYDFTWYTANPKATTFYISNADQLAGFSAIVGGMLGHTADNFEGKTVILRNDINIDDMDSENRIVFYPIGYYNSTGQYSREGYVGNSNVVSGIRAFKGTFDGNGNTISNFYQNTWEMFGDYNSGYSGTPNYYKDAMGLFGAIYGAQIKNLIIDNFQSDGEFTPTGCVAAYAGGPGMLFENIILTNCNPRVYNTGNGGIVGLNYNSTSGTADSITFRNITVDQTNKISALWGSYDVSCGGILGRLRENSKHDGTNTDGNKNTVTFENCHVSAIMDVNNDVCANYQYYQYRYSGMFIGTVDYIDDVADVGIADVVSATGCTYKIGEWNEYWYCELVANSLASYTHDHQFSRLTKIASVSEIQDASGNWTKEGNFVIPAADNSSATCYHIFKDAEENLYRHFHDVEDESNPEIYESKDINGDGQLNDLKEDRQCYLIPFNQLFTGYGWGSSPQFAYGNISTDGSETSSKKFGVAADFDGYINSGDKIAASDIFVLLEGKTVAANSLNVYLSPVGEDSTVLPQHISGTTLAELGSLPFYGYGKAKITITDYWYCTPTVIEVEVVDVLLDEDFSGENAMDNWKNIASTEGSYDIIDEKLTYTVEGTTSNGVTIINNQLSGVQDLELNYAMQMPAYRKWTKISLRNGTSKIDGIIVYFYHFGTGSKDANNRIRILKGGSEISSASVSYIPKSCFDSLQDVKITLIGNNITVSIGGTEYVNYTGDELIPNGGGTIAFQTYGYSATYDDIKVIDRSNYLLRESFDDPTKVTDWEHNGTNGAFAIQNGALKVTETGKYGNYIHYEPGLEWSDYEVTASFATGGGTWTGLVLRSNGDYNAQNSYHIRMLNGKIRFYKFVNGSYQTDDGGKNVEIASYTAGETVNIRVTAVGNVITVYRDGTKLYTHTETAETHATGTVGFWNDANYPNPEYEGIRIKDLT